MENNEKLSKIEMNKQGVFYSSLKNQFNKLFPEDSEVFFAEFNALNLERMPVELWNMNVVEIKPLLQLTGEFLEKEKEKLGSAFKMEDYIRKNRLSFDEDLLNNKARYELWCGNFRVFTEWGIKYNLEKN